MKRINFVLSWVEHGKRFKTSGPDHFGGLGFLMHWPNWIKMFFGCFFSNMEVSFWFTNLLYVYQQSPLIGWNCLQQICTKAHAWLCLLNLALKYGKNLMSGIPKLFLAVIHPWQSHVYLSTVIFSSTCMWQSYVRNPKTIFSCRADLTKVMSTCPQLILFLKIQHKRSHNKTIDAFFWGWCQDLSTLENDVHHGFTLVDITFSGWQIQILFSRECTICIMLLKHSLTTLGTLNLILREYENVM